MRPSLPHLVYVSSAPAGSNRFLQSTSAPSTLAAAPPSPFPWKHSPPLAANSFEHPSIVHAIPVGITLSQIKSTFPADSPHRARLRLTKHRVPDNPPRPSTVVLFQPCSANPHRCLNPSHRQSHHQGQRHLLRQRGQRAAHQDNPVPLLRMPGHLIHCCREEPWDSESHLPRTLPRGLLRFYCGFPPLVYAAQVHLVGVAHHLNSSRRQPRCPRHPQKIIPDRD